MVILSINLDHDASVCLLKDGKIEYFQKEERLSRTKHDYVPYRCIIEASYIIKGDIDAVLISKMDNSYFFSGIEKFLYSFFKSRIKAIYNYSFLTHHNSHACVSFFNSGFDKSLVVVADRSGSTFYINNSGVAAEGESVFLFDKQLNKKNILYKNFLKFINFNQLNLNLTDNNLYQSLETYYSQSSTKIDLSVTLRSLSAFYCTASHLMGQNLYSAGKVMGLSSYCTDKKFNFFETNNLIVDPNDPNMFFTANFEGYSSEVAKDADSYGLLTSYDGYIPKNFTHVDDITIENFLECANYSKFVQTYTSTQLLALIKKYVKLTNIENVCLSGGYANNIVTNAFLKKELPNINFYFEPVCDDTGISIGNAYDFYTADKSKAIDNKNFVKYSKHSEVHKLNFMSFDFSEYLDSTKIITPPLDNFYLHYKNETLRDTRAINFSIENLLDFFLRQKTIAIFEGNPEAGQRALGHRSIIFDPRNLNGKDIVNKTKKREWYRPFAGVIRKEDFLDYFEDIGFNESPNMMVNFDANPHTVKEFPSIIHIDNTCRIQTVTDGFFYDFITLLKEKTGCPIILNTSFNLAGEPLVHTVEDAIITFDNSSLDAVYFVKEKRIIFK